MVDPEVRDWERLRKEIPAIESKSIDNAMAACHKGDWEEQDVVNSPSHYNSGGIECIDAIAESMTDEGFKAYCKGNVQKYLWRYEMKGKPLEDLKKAEWYLSRLIKSQEIEDGY